MLFRQVAFGSHTWRAIVALGFFATASHGVLDAFTDAGLGVGFFVPFDDACYFFPWRPIATSPLSIGAFFNGPALRILSNELLWRGLPLAGFVTSVALVRRAER